MQEKHAFEQWVLVRTTKPQATKSKQEPKKSSNAAETKETEDDNEFTGLHSARNAKSLTNAHLIGSGANVDMTNDKSILQDYKSMSEPVDITWSSGDPSPAYGEGTLRINNSPPITISGGLFVPGITKTLFATKSFTKQGLTVIIDDEFKIQQGGM